jgi:hypothetical protein
MTTSRIIFATRLDNNAHYDAEIAREHLALQLATIERIA